MDRLSQIEADLATQLITIDKTLQPEGYTYYNDVTICQQEDESIADVEDAYPVINIYLDPEETVLSGVSRAFQNTVRFRLECRVENDVDTDNPKFTILRKMNEIVSDLKYNLSKDQATLGRTVDNIKIVRITRDFAIASNDNFRTGNCNVVIDVNYSQSRMNPDINACI